MYSVYAVAIKNGEKERHFIAATENEFEAKHMANVVTCMWADYAYVKTFGEGTVFFIRKPEKLQPIKPS
jgi:hypothetical protein